MGIISEKSSIPETKINITQVTNTIEPINNSLIACIGNTPLLFIERINNVKLYAKAEWLNPGGSVKDRAAKSIILNGIKNRSISKDKILVDATSGNTGIAYAMICAILGLKLRLYIPKNASSERIKILKAYNVDIVLTDPLEGIDGAILEARKYTLENKNTVYLDQYNNQNNWKAHYETTAEEIFQQTNRKITHFVCGLGTTGTFTGVSKRLKEYNPHIKRIAVQPDSPFHGIEGLKHLKTSIVPGIFDPSLVDERISIKTEEAQLGVRKLAEKGLLVGTSAGAAYMACKKIAKQIKKGVLVTIFPDRGERYFSTNIWRN